MSWLSDREGAFRQLAQRHYRWLPSPATTLRLKFADFPRATAQRDRMFPAIRLAVQYGVELLIGHLQHGSLCKVLVITKHSERVFEIEGGES